MTLQALKQAPSGWALFLLLFLTPSACNWFGSSVLAGKAISGKVVEQGSEKPVAGAIVLAHWMGISPGLVDSRTVCYHVLSTTSGPNGEFQFPAWEKAAKDWQRKIRPKHVSVTAYKTGYDLAVAGPDRTVRLKAFSGTAKERFQSLTQTASATACLSAGESEKNLLELMKVIHEEARGLAKTPEDERMVELLRFQLEVIELGPEAAEKRHLQRIEDRK